MIIDITVKNVKIIRDKNTGHILGYGFLEFDSPSTAANALNILNGQKMPFSENKTFKLNWASYSQSKSAPNPNEFSIYVCELDPSLTEDMLRDFFSQIYSSVVGAKIIVDPSTKISKGYGFVKFSDYNESQRALVEMNGKMINGKPMKTNQASFKKAAMNDNKKKQYTNNYSNVNNNNNMMYQQQDNLYNDQNAMMQQQYYYMTNGYYPNQYMNQMYYNMYPYYQNNQQVQDQNGNTNMNDINK